MTSSGIFPLIFSENPIPYSGILSSISIVFQYYTEEQFSELYILHLLFKKKDSIINNFIFFSIRIFILH